VNSVPISARGYAERARELEQLRAGVRRRPRLHLAEEHATVIRRIAVLEGQLAVAQVVPPVGDGVVGLGSSVRVVAADGEERVYELVGPLEADIGSGRLSVSAPVGRALFGRRSGDRVEVETPGGLERLVIAAVLPPPEIGSRPHGGGAAGERS